MNLSQPAGTRRHTPPASPAPARRSGRGFSLIELVIVVVIIGIIAAIAIPRMSRGSAGAADSALAQNVSVIRNALDSYQAEHNGLYPVAGSGVTVPDLLLKFSNIDGTAVSPSKDTTNNIIYGPYLRSIPPITVGDQKGSNGISTTSTPGAVATGGVGIAWLYNTADGTVQPNASGNDSGGRAYSSY